MVECSLILMIGMIITRKKSRQRQFFCALTANVVVPHKVMKVCVLILFEQINELSKLILVSFISLVTALVGLVQMT